jgi:hypothetical protein
MESKMDTRFDTSPLLISGVSWGAIFAGVFVALSVATILNLLGLGLDLLAIGTHKGNLSHMGLASIIWVVLTSIFAMLAGGWVAGRMSGPSLATEGAMHGIVMCAVAIFITFVLAASSIGSFIGVMSTVIAQSTSVSEIVHQKANPMPMMAPKNNMQTPMVDYQNQLQFHHDVHDYFVAGNQADETQAQAKLNDYLVQNQGMTPAEAQQTIDNLQKKKQQIKVNADNAAKNLGTLVLVFFMSFLLSAIASAFGGIWGAASDREIFVRKQVKVNNY